jgi:hypothetical protein
MSARRFASSSARGRVPTRLTTQDLSTCVLTATTTDTGTATTTDTDTSPVINGGPCSMGATYTVGTSAKTYFGSTTPAGVDFRVVGTDCGRPDLACAAMAKAAVTPAEGAGAAAANSAYCFAQTDANGLIEHILYGECTDSSCPAGDPVVANANCSVVRKVPY